MASIKDQLVDFTNMINPTAKLDQAAAEVKTEVEAAKEAAIAYATLDLGLKIVSVGVLIGILYYSAQTSRSNKKGT